ncbi:MAG: hypothetical protein Q9162_006743 [Coniocarpon cinnabarinum]
MTQVFDKEPRDQRQEKIRQWVREENKSVSLKGMYTWITGSRPTSSSAPDEAAVSTSSDSITAPIGNQSSVDLKELVSHAEQKRTLQYVWLPTKEDMGPLAFLAEESKMGSRRCLKQSLEARNLKLSAGAKIELDGVKKRYLAGTLWWRLFLADANLSAWTKNHVQDEVQVKKVAEKFVSDWIEVKRWQHDSHLYAVPSSVLSG